MRSLNRTISTTISDSTMRRCDQGLGLLWLQVGLAGGNQALALLLLVVSNILCIVTSQLWLKAVLVSIGGHNYLFHTLSNLTHVQTIQSFIEIRARDSSGVGVSHMSVHGDLTHTWF